MSTNCTYCDGEGRFAVGSNRRDWVWEECPYCVDLDENDELNYSEVANDRTRRWDDSSSWEPSTEDDLPW